MSSANNGDRERIDALIANMSYARELMRFHLVFRGLLPSAGNKPKPSYAAHIRKKLHPQLQELWRTHHVMKRVARTGIIKRDDGAAYLVTSEGPFDVERDIERFPAGPDEVDLTGPIISGGHSFRPLIRESLQLNCSLSVTFLRHDDPLQGVTQNGDLDGRIKCLLDALTMPKPEIAVRFPPQSEPMYCLMESDALISDLEIETGRLLSPGDRHKHEVQLIIEVAVNVLRVGPWNMPLLGN